MLAYLQIRNFAIIDYLEIDFSAGMSAITGETGAGKSIAVDALSLLLGDRADSSVVRHGAEHAELCAVFDIQALAHVREWLQAHDLFSGEECQLRRIISAQGRSRNYINGSVQPLTLLRELGEWLADIHSQHEHQSLLRREVQRQLLDDFGGHHKLCTQVSAQYRHWQELAEHLRYLNEDSAEREARLDLLRYQLQELHDLALEANEPKQLFEEHRRLANSGRLLAVTQNALDQLYDNDQYAMQTRLSRLAGDLDTVLDLDPRLRPIAELISNAILHINEASYELRDYCQHSEQDPERLQWLEERLSTMHRLARKHQCSPEQLPQRSQDLSQELAQLDSSDWNREALVRKTESAEAEYRLVAAQLSQQRIQTARRLSAQISTSMQTLGMQGGVFRVALTPSSQAAAHGLEQIEFQVSANPGQPPQALTKVASGGELSRISLALQMIAARSTAIPTLIFDEVDTGIGGSVAETVGHLLRQLGQHRQVICVTHLPQVAAQAHQHWRVKKVAAHTDVNTHADLLDQTQRIEELARMLGGSKMTAKTLAHAREMIQQAAAV